MITRGQKINDRYQIIRTIGEGGMANVYLAHDTILDRDVAVKVLRGDLAGDEKFVRRFQREAIAASSLSHPSIVEMYDVGEDDGNYFIVMEYVEGQTLKNLIKKRGALTLSEVIDIMLQLTSGLACAHESYIIHRDIKPQNILILDDGRVKITDFGIAMALNSNELTQTNSVMGSVHYLPPEQANGNGATIKSDIYSTGILMFELLTGKIPFKGENAVEIAIKQMKDPIPSVCEINSEIPQSIENIVLKATAKNPKNRYDSVMDMHNDLKTALDNMRKDEPKVVFQYPEYDMMEDTAKITKTKQSEQNGKEQIEDEQEKKVNKALLITGILVAVIAIIGAIVLFILPSGSKIKELEIPDVSGMTVTKAEKKLEKAGFSVKDDVIEKNSDTIEEGLIIETQPKIGRTAKKGATITLIVSKGQNGFTVENYVGQNYYTVKATLEANGVTVELEEEEHTEADGIDPNIVLAQSVKADEMIKTGETIKLTIPKIVVLYPDFTTGYTIEEIRAFCKENGIALEESSIETTSYKEGAIITQTKTAGEVIKEGDSLKVTIASAPVTHIVTFKNDDSTYQTVNVQDGKSVGEPPTPTKDGYTFQGWFLNGKAYNFSSVVTEDITLTATWAKKTVTTPEKNEKPTESDSTANKEEDDIDSSSQNEAVSEDTKE